MVPSYSVSETKAFFTELLKFDVIMDSPDYCVVAQGQFEIHIQRAGEDIGEMSFYMSVDDLDAVWSLLKDRKDSFQLREPFDQPYGMRELHIIVPHTKALLFIGMPLSEEKKA